MAESAFRFSTERIEQHSRVSWDYRSVLCVYNQPYIEGGSRVEAPEIVESSFAES